MCWDSQRFNHFGQFDDVKPHELFSIFVDLIDLLVDVEQHLEEDIDHTRLYLLLDRLWELEEPERCHIGTEHFKEFVLVLAVDVGIVTVILTQVPFELYCDAVQLIVFEF